MKRSGCKDPLPLGEVGATAPGEGYRASSFCLETLSIGRWAVIDRAYSVDSATVGAVYDRPICSFETETRCQGSPPRTPRLSFPVPMTPQPPCSRTPPAP